MSDYKVVSTLRNPVEMYLLWKPMDLVMQYTVNV